MLLPLLNFAPFILAAGLAGSLFAGQPNTNLPPNQPAPRADAFSVLDRFERMTPEQRERFLGNLPPVRRQQFEIRLGRYRRMTPEQRQQVREQYELFRDLPKPQQDALRRTFQRFNDLATERRRLLRREYQRLRLLPDADRRARINGDEFRSRYNLGEQQLLDDMSKLLPRPVSPSALNAAPK